MQLIKYTMQFIRKYLGCVAAPQTFPLPDAEFRPAPASNNTMRMRLTPEEQVVLASLSPWFERFLKDTGHRGGIITMDCPPCVPTVIRFALTGEIDDIYVGPPGDSLTKMQTLLDLTKAAHFLNLEFMFNNVGDSALLCAFGGRNERFERGMLKAGAAGVTGVAAWHRLRREHHHRILLQDSRTAGKVKLVEMSAADLARVHLMDPVPGVVMRHPDAQPGPLRMDSIRDDLAAYLPLDHPDMPWCHKSADGVGIVVAGGCLESLLLGDEPRDIDVFAVVPPGVPNPQLRLMQLQEKLVSALTTGKKAMYEYVQLHRTLMGNVVNMMLHPYDPKPDQGPVKLQLINALFDSPAQVIGGFDLDCSRVLYDGRSLKSDEMGMCAWRNMCFPYSPYTLSRSVLARVLKKYRAGMGVLLVDVTPDELLEMQCRSDSPRLHEPASDLKQPPPTLDVLVRVLTHEQLPSGMPWADYEEVYQDRLDRDTVATTTTEATAGFKRDRKAVKDDASLRAFMRKYPTFVIHERLGVAPQDEQFFDGLTGETTTVYIYTEALRMSGQGDSKLRRHFTGSFNPVKCAIYQRTLVRPAWATEEPDVPEPLPATPAPYCPSECSSIDDADLRDMELHF